MDSLFIEFLEAYKSLDELCKQILYDNKGISKYIEEMENDRFGKIYVQGWVQDYKQLKHMRWIRNKLVHEVDASNYYDISNQDIIWLNDFKSRILSCTDPFSLLNQTRNEIKSKQQRKTSNSKVVDTTTNTRKHIASERKFNKICLLFIIIAFMILFILLFQK